MALMFCKMCMIEMHNSQFTQYKASFEQEPFLLTIREHHTQQSVTGKSHTEQVEIGNPDCAMCAICDHHSEALM